MISTQSLLRAASLSAVIILTISVGHSQSDQPLNTKSTSVIKPSTATVVKSGSDNSKKWDTDELIRTKVKKDAEQQNELSLKSGQDDAASQQARVKSEKEILKAQHGLVIISTRDFENSSLENRRLIESQPDIYLVTDKSATEVLAELEGKSPAK